MSQSDRKKITKEEHSSHGSIQKILPTRICQEQFIKIVYSWFHSSFLKNSVRHQMNIDDLINVCYKYHATFTGIVLAYYHIGEHGWKNMALNTAENVSDLWLIHSDNNVYRIMDCHDPPPVILNDINSDQITKYTHEKYLKKSKMLSNKQNAKLLQIIINLQINMRYKYRELGGFGWRNNNTYLIGHCGKQIAQEYGYNVQEYETWTEINCDELMRFMDEEMQIDVKSI